MKSLAPLIGIMVLIAIIVRFFWWILGAAALTGVFFLVRALIREDRARRAAIARRHAEIAARAETQHRWVLRGDPAEHKAYLHRSGRTARAGSAGDVVTVVLPEQRKDLAALMRKADINVRPQQVTAHCEPVIKLVGDVAVYRAPAPKAASAASTATARSGRRRPAPGAGRRRKPVHG